MKLLQSLLIFMLLASSVYGQSFYAVTDNNYLKKITISAGGLTSVDISTCQPYFTYSIALYNNSIYSQNSGYIFKGDISGNSVVNCQRLAAVALSGNSLTADSAGLLYFNSNNLLLTFNPKTNSVVNLGAMPYAPSGDFIFYKKQLFMATGYGIVKINTSNPAQSSLVIPSNLVIYGLSAVAYSSSQIKVYATAINSSFNGTDLYELDLDNNTILTKIGTLPYIVYDAGSDVEDGVIPKIKINTVLTSPDCPYTGKGTLQVICNNPLVDYTYTFNNTITNSTGIFAGISPGTYDLKITSSNQVKDTTITIDQHAFDRPVLTPVKIDENCDRKGQISFNVSGNNSLYNIQFNANTFPINQVFSGLTAGSYHFNLLTQNGCIIDSANVTLQRLKCAIITDSVAVHKECADLRKADIQVYSRPHTSATYSYIFNNVVTNTTGLFSKVDPGTYPLSIITSDGLRKDTTVTVPDYYANRIIVIPVPLNENCDQKGQISFTTHGQASLYTLQYNSANYPISHVFQGLIAGNYHFNLIDRNGCLIDTFNVILQRIKCAISGDSVSVFKECTDLHNGDIQVFHKSNTSVTYSFIFNNLITNNTGLFTNIVPGAYPVSTLTSDGVRKDTIVTVPDFYLSRTIATPTTIDENCDQPGQISFNMKGNAALFNIRFNSTLYPANHAFSGLLAGRYHFDLFTKGGCLIDTFNVALQRVKCAAIVDSITVQKECNDLHNGKIQVYCRPHTSTTYSYTFNNSITNTTGFFNMIKPGTYPLTVLTSEGIRKDTTVTVPDFYLTRAIAIPTSVDENCDQKGQISFVMNGNASRYNISTGSSTFSLPHVFTNLAAGGYHFSLVTLSGCLIDTFYVALQRIKCPVTLNALAINKECNDLNKGNIQATAIPHQGVTYTYTLNKTTSNPSGYFGMLAPGTYSLDVLSSEGISKDTSLTVPDYLYLRPTTTYSFRNQICDLFGQIAVTSTGQAKKGYNIKLGPDVFPSGHVFTGLLSGSYQFFVQTQDGCLADTLTVNLKKVMWSKIVGSNL